MSMNKLLMPLLPLFLESITGRKDQGGLVAQVQLLNIITNEVKKQISKLILKIAFGLVASGVLIYSLIILGQYLHAYMLTFQDGQAFSMIFFGLVSVGCIAALIQMFRPEKTVTPIRTLQDSVHSFSFEKILTNFMEGLTQGVEQAQQRADERAEQRAQERADRARTDVASQMPDGDSDAKFREPNASGGMPHSDSNYRYSPSAN